MNTLFVRKGVNLSKSQPVKLGCVLLGAVLLSGLVGLTTDNEAQAQSNRPAQSVIDRMRGSGMQNNGTPQQQQNNNGSNNQANQQQSPNQGRADARSYMMTCRGGGADSTVQINTYGKNTLTFNFDKAAQAATAAPVQAGQCAWQDRALRSDEPTKLVYHTEGLSLNVAFNPATNNFSTLQIVNNQGNRGSTPEKLLNMIRSNNPFFVHAKRSPDGNSFIITQVGL